jgi:hypothetical protein
MAVVINDFEVVAESPATGVAPQPAEAAGPPSAPEVERVLQNLAERLARVEAH